MAVRCAAVVVGVWGCRDIIFEEALDITGGGDRMAGPTVLAPIMPPSPPSFRFYLNLNMWRWQGFEGYQTRLRFTDRSNSSN